MDAVRDLAYKTGRFKFGDQPFVFIYGLFDPVSGALRYIGKSATPSRRMKSHLLEAEEGRTSHKAAWISQLMNQNMKPSMKILAVVDDDNWERMEREFIARARRKRFPLVNIADGGEGLRKGFKHSEEAVRNMSLARLGKPLSAEHRRSIAIGQIGNKRGRITGLRISLAKSGKPGWNKGIKMQECAREKMIKALTGRKLSEEHRKNLSAAQTGRRHSEETKQRMRAAWVRRKAL